VPFSRNPFFFSVRDIVRIGIVENILGALSLFVGFRVRRNQNIALFDFSFVLFGLILGNAEALARKQIAKIYLADAIVELAFFAGWIGWIAFSIA
jgi:hypothetical protein